MPFRWKERRVLIHAKLLSIQLHKPDFWKLSLIPVSLTEIIQSVIKSCHVYLLPKTLNSMISTMSSPTFLSLQPHHLCKTMPETQNCDLSINSNLPAILKPRWPSQNLYHSSNIPHWWKTLNSLVCKDLQHQASLSFSTLSPTIHLSNTPYFSHAKRFPECTTPLSLRFFCIFT